MAFLGRKLYIIIFLLLAALPPCAFADDNIQLAEQKIKVGLLYNFLKYTDWPAENETAPINVCVYGGDPFGGSLQPMEGRSVNQREIKLNMISDISETSQCQLLYINQSQQGNWTDIHNKLAGKNILTVSDFDGFAAKGGMIEFDRKENHVGAELNVSAVNNAGLKVQDRLLKLVTIMHGGKNE